MRVREIAVSNYRSIVSETLTLEPLRALIGRNGAGKTSFLQALRLFMDPAAHPVSEDYYNRLEKNQIKIEVVFSDLNIEEEREFKASMSDGVLSVQRRFPHGDYYGKTFGCEELEPIREMLRVKAKAADTAIKLEKMIQTGQFPGLQAVKRSIEEELDRWESENPQKCKHYFRAGVFQGPPNIAGGKLRSRTNFVYIPPVRQAETDATGSSKQSPLGALVAPLIDLITEKNQEVSKMKANLAENYVQYVSLVRDAPEKKTLEEDLTLLLNRYNKDTSARIQLNLDEILTLPPPKPLVWLAEDGFEGDVSRKGHGRQRLFIFAILELYERSRLTADEESGGNILLVIEEPELYQHPARSRALAGILNDLCRPKEKMKFEFQILYTTHSPCFVNLQKFDCVRRVEKVSSLVGPMQSKIRMTTLKEVGKIVTESLGLTSDVTEDSSWARLKAIFGHKGAEALFANSVVLVEGPEDEAILTAYAEHSHGSLDREDIAILPSEGKTKLPWLLVLYKKLGINTYTIFDADGEKPIKEAHPETNRALLSMIGEKPEGQPKTLIAKDGACWENCFTDELRRDFGEDVWNNALEQACREYGVSSGKNVVAIHRTVQILLQDGRKSQTLDKLWAAISKSCIVGVEEAAESSAS